MPSRIQVGLNAEASAPLSDIINGFRSGFVWELIDTRFPEPLAVHALVINPRRYTLSEPFQSTLTPTEDDTVVAEENGLIVREITIEGTMGVSRKRTKGVRGAQGAGGEMSGSEHFMHLRAFFRKYSDLKKNPRTSPYTKMLFHNMREDDHFVVVPRAFETPRDAKSARIHFEYRITMAAIAEAANTFGSLEIERDSDILRDIASAFNDARAFFAEANAKVSILKRKVGNIGTVMLNAAAMINAVSNLVKGVSEFVVFPFSLAATSLEAIEYAADTLCVTADTVDDVTFREAERHLRRMSASLERIAQYKERFGRDSTNDLRVQYAGEKLLTEEDIATGRAGAGIGSRTRVVAGSEADAGIDLATSTGARAVRVDRSTTLEGLAGRYGTTPEAIALINDIRFPYFAEGGGPGLLAPGDVIFVPVADQAADLGARSEYLSAEELLYGTDIALDPVELQNGYLDILVNETHDSDDADLVSGINCLIQGTEITLHTDRGSTTFIPDLGVRRAVGVKGTIENVLLSAVVLREALLLDPRIEGIQDMRVVLDGDVLTQDITPQVIGQSSTPVTFALPIGSPSGGG